MTEINHTATIELTAPTAAGMIEECRQKLDRWLSQFPAPGKYQTYDIQLIRWHLPHSVTYRLNWRQMNGPEYKQDYYNGKNENGK